MSNVIAELMVKIGADDSGLNSKLSGITGKLKSLGGVAANAVKTTAKVVGATAGAAGAAVGKIVKDAVSAYGEYEQLAGGIETLYGEAANSMMENAKKAFKTAGMSANEYMNTAIESSAAMIKAVEGDTKRAAELTNQAIIDMSDNVNKMGTTMEAVQNAYRGFSRGNFTMLDNLALGYAGTKNGMEELLEDATKLSGVEYDIDSYADMVEAIHVIQDNMGITGTTREEADKTVTGSLGSMKAAYENLITGLGDKDANLDQLFDDLFKSAFGDGETKGVIGNMMPVFQQALTSLGTVISTNLPTLLNKLPGFLEENLPGFINAVGNILTAIGGFLKTQLPVLIDKAKTWISNNWPKIRDAVKDILDKVLDWAKKNLPTMAGDFGEAIGTFLGDAAEYIIPKLPEILGTLFDAAFEFFTGIFDALDEKIPGLGALLEGLTTIVLIGVAAWKGYQAGLAISQAIQTVKAGIVSLTAAVEGSTVAQNLLNAAQAAAPYLLLIAGIVAVIAVIKNLWDNCEEFRQFWTDAWEGLKQVVSDAWEAIKGWAEKLWQNISDAWEGLKQLASDVCGAIGDFFNGIWDAMSEAIGWVIEKIKGLIGWIEKAIDGFNNMMDAAVEAVLGDAGMGEAHAKANKQYNDLVNDPEYQAKLARTKANYAAKNGGSSSTSGMSSYVPASASDYMKNKRPYAKAMNNAYLLDGATIFGAMDDSLLVGGERGQEMIVGTDYLAGMIQDAYEKVEGSNGQRIIIPVYIGQRKIDEIVVDSINRSNYITGGR